MNTYLNGRVVVITGAASGFGLLVAEKAAAMGAKIVGGDVDGEQLQAVFERLGKEGGACAHRRTDVTERDQVRALAEFAVETFGRIDVMINNAGLMPLSFFADHERAAAKWDRAIDVNVKGVLNGIAAVYDQMIAQGRGHIVNISSIYSNFATEGAGVYTATKAAVNAISESLRVETQGKIKVSIVRPSGIPRTGLGASVVNRSATIGLVGHHAQSAAEHMAKYLHDELPPELMDPDSPALWTLEPEQLAEQIIYVINQPWGVSISDITVRATGEEFVL